MAANSSSGYAGTTGDEVPGDSAVDGEYWG